MEKLRKESWKNLVLATLIILSMYAGIYLIAFHLISDTMLSKELVVVNILLYTHCTIPNRSSLWIFHGFSPSLLALVLLLYPVTIFSLRNGLFSIRLSTPYVL